MNPVTEAILSVPPRSVEAVGLLHRLHDQGRQPDTATLLRLGPEIEAALHDVDDLSWRTKEVVDRCLKLSPAPAKSPPPGF